MALNYDKGCCQGCGSCVEACPVNVWEMEDGKAVLARPDDCVECGACVDACPGNCISLD